VAHQVLAQSPCLSHPQQDSVQQAHSALPLAHQQVASALLEHSAHWQEMAQAEQQVGSANYLHH
jgi:hypothetical protein